MGRMFGAVLSEEEIERRTSIVWPYKYFEPGRAVDPGEIDEIFEGLVDVHVHGGPAGAWQPGRPTMVQTMLDASAKRMKGLVFKDHNCMNNNCAIIINDFLERMRRDAAARGESFTPTTCYGGIVLNYGVGGMNMTAVKKALGYGKCVEVWLGSLDTRYQYRLMGKEGGIAVSDEQGTLTPEMIQLLELLSDYNSKTKGERCALSACHTSNAEKFDMLRYIKKRGLNVDVLIDHCTQELTIVTPEEAKEMIDLGAYLEFAETACVPWPSMQNWIINFDYSFNLIRELVKEKGPEHLLICSDGGQSYHDYVPGMTNFIRTLLSQGVSKADLRVMCSESPSRILGI